MLFKILASVIAAALLILFVGPVVFKLRETALIVVVGIGIAMMLVDIWQSLNSSDD